MRDILLFWVAVLLLICGAAWVIGLGPSYNKYLFPIHAPDIKDVRLQFERDTLDHFY